MQEVFTPKILHIGLNYVPDKPQDHWKLFVKPDTKLFNVPRNSRIILVLPHYSEPCKLFTNYPNSSANPTSELTLVYDNFQNQYTTELEFREPGNYEFKLTLEDGRESEIGYLLVQPELQINKNQSIPLNAVVMQTVLTRNLGNYKRWKRLLENSVNLNYNVIHFTPVQKLGISGSAYSIYDQAVLTDLLSDENQTDSEEEKERRLIDIVKYLENKGTSCICDVVWNHTAINTPWLPEHPEACYSIQNCPYLRPAYCLDRLLEKYNDRLERRAEIVSTPEDVEKIMGELERRIIPSARLWEFFVLDVAKHLPPFKAALENPDFVIEEDNSHKHHPLASGLTESCIIHGNGTRGSKIVRLSCALKLFAKNNNLSIAEKCLAYRRAIDQYNSVYFQQVHDDTVEILQNLKNYMIHERLNPHGPKSTFVSKQTPLFPKYFTTIVEKPFNFEAIKLFLFDEDDDFIERPIDGSDNIAVANAGWVMGLENTVDYTSEKERVYFRRRLMVWSDSVKLRYGQTKEDSPFLWKLMKNYTRQIAKIFHGVRLDNCHSTPIHVAKYLLNHARKIRKNFYVTAELFTTPANEVTYCEKLGLTSLIGEAMQAGSPKDLGDKVFNYSGSLKNAIGAINPETNFFGDNRVWLDPDSPPRILFDCTHDNEPPPVKRTAADSLPNAAFVSMPNCAIGSTLGYDQLIPHKIDVVLENRLYPFETVGGGIECCKEVLNSLHQQLVAAGYTEFNVYQEGNYFILMRHQPNNHKSVYMIIHTQFEHKPFLSNNYPSFSYSGEFNEELFVGILSTDQLPFKPDANYITGINPTLFWPHSQATTSPTKSMYYLHENHIKFTRFPPGSLICFLSKLTPEASTALENLKAQNNTIEMSNAFSELSLVELNRILYRCESEEGTGVYVISGAGPCSYCGIAGIIPLLKTITKENSVTHPLSVHLREGHWILDYYQHRIPATPNCEKYFQWYKKNSSFLKLLPNFLLPKYFYWFIMKIYNAALQRSFVLMSSFIRNSDWFVKGLSLVSIQLFGDIPAAPLDYYTKNHLHQESPSLAAGIPHFSIGYMRNWGRDTFISLRGLLLVTGRLPDALTLIKSYASCLRHGLIPNLLDSCENPRYNARDAVWWFLQGVQDYCKFAYHENYEAIIYFLNSTEIRMKFSDTEKLRSAEQEKYMKLSEIIQEILQRHADGISFREWNAGVQIDSLMSDEGFNVSAHLDFSNGFVYGGNEFNCGTWMDKMGDGTKKGIPATPRDGADIEIVGLLASTLNWLSKLNANGYEFKGIKLEGGESLSYSDWFNKIKENFENKFWIPTSSVEDKSFNVKASMINRRGIYKDVYGCSKEFSDYQFRPNQLIAMAVAPEIFTRSRAQHAIQLVTENLLGPLGVKTLDPIDWQYSPFYDCTSTTPDDTEFGINYHQGPEWVWLFGIYLRALVNFTEPSEFNKLKNTFRVLLKPHRKHIETSPWAGLPELTNKGGVDCPYSCYSQAWSASTILDALHALNHALE